MEELTWIPPAAVTVQFATHDCWVLGNIFISLRLHYADRSYKKSNILNTKSNTTYININDVKVREIKTSHEIEQLGAAQHGRNV